MYHKNETNIQFFNQPKQGEFNKAQEKQNSLIRITTALNQNFLIDSKSRFTLYPFSNESYFSEALRTMENTEPKKVNSIRIALLFGESNFISMLPELLNHTDLIVLADIEPLLHYHTTHLLSCLNKANTPNEFIVCYKDTNPIAGLKYIDDDGKMSSWDINKLIDILAGKIAGATSLQDYCFLANIERYNQCKTAASKLMFTHINLNLLEIDQCQKFVSILKKHNATFSLCNFTNIHHYDDKNQLQQTVPLLLQESPDCFLMYAEGIGDLDTNISQNLNDYFSKKTTHSSPQFIVEDYDLDIDEATSGLYQL